MFTCSHAWFKNDVIIVDYMVSPYWEKYQGRINFKYRIVNNQLEFYEVSVFYQLVFYFTMKETI